MSMIVCADRRPSCLEYAAVLWFNVWLSLSTLTIYLLCVLSLAAFDLWPAPEQRCVAAAMRRCCRFFWTLPFAMCPWIRVKIEGLDVASRQLGSSGKPVLIMANHTSFMDSLLISAHAEYRHMARLITFAKSTVFRMPIFGAIARSVGHIAVHFQTTRADDFATCPEKKAQMLHEIHSHFALGGWVCMFPEGQMHTGNVSRNTRTLQDFRVGGIKIALQHDVELWAWVAKGNNDCWPRGALGGLPATIEARLVPLAPQGCRALLNRLRRDESSAAPELDYDALHESLPLLVAHLQSAMQHTPLDDLYEGRPAPRAAGTHDGGPGVH